MSEMVHYKGTLLPVDKIGNETLEDQCKRISGREKEGYDTYAEVLLDYEYKNYVVHNDILYRVSKREIANDSDVFNATRHENGLIDFEVLYYNGGCSFDEAIGYALEDAE